MSVCVTFDHFWMKINFNQILIKSGEKIRSTHTHRVEKNRWEPITTTTTTTTTTMKFKLQKKTVTKIKKKNLANPSTLCLIQNR